MGEDVLRAMIESASVAAERRFKQDGGVGPTYLAIDAKSRVHVFPLDVPCKDIGVALVRAWLALIEAQRYVFMDEAWVLDRRGGMTDAELASFKDHGIADHPERVEVIHFSAEDHEAGQLTAHRVINRAPGRLARLGPLVFPFGSGEGVRSEGRMVGLLPVKGTLQ